MGGLVGGNSGTENGNSLIGAKNPTTNLLSKEGESIPMVTGGGRGSNRIPPYIPIPLNTPIEINNTLRRASRLYPMFKRIKRNIPKKQIKPTSTLHFGIPEIKAAAAAAATSTSTTTLIYNKNNNNNNNDESKKFPKKVLTKKYDISSSMDTMKIIPASTIKTSVLTTTTDTNINNFIANLADNVKFSSDDISDVDSNFKTADNRLGAVAAAAATTATTSLAIGGEAFPSYDNDKLMTAFHVTYWMFYPYSQVGHWIMMALMMALMAIMMNIHGNIPLIKIKHNQNEHYVTTSREKACARSIWDHLVVYHSQQYMGIVWAVQRTLVAISVTGSI